MSLESEMAGYCLNAGVFFEEIPDVLQNTWIRIMEGLHAYDIGQGELGAWYMGCLKHSVGDWRRIDTFGRAHRKIDFRPIKLAHSKAVAGRMEDRILEKIDRDRLRCAVRAFLKRLSPRQERLLTRHYLDEQMWADVAAEEDVTENAAKLAARYGMARLERELQAAVWPDQHRPPRRANERC